ncbi:hypothetical protein [Phaeovulum sp. W22_SRMD_FR3]|uniref:hypothetical protein n=1 Tax=Phaeovulum sp. W22_SRMD_FR3 TaxID=3240274 RepID=UPI003F9A3703
MISGAERQQSWIIAGAVAVLVLAVVYGAGASFLLALFLAITACGLIGSFLTWFAGVKASKNRARHRVAGKKNDGS